MRNTGKAFTLIELLVVVAIIVILIAILLPSLGKAKQQAVKVSCGSQLRQMGIAIRTYAHENNDYAPPFPTGDTGEDEAWHSNATFNWWNGTGAYAGMGGYAGPTGLGIAVLTEHLQRVEFDGQAPGIAGGRPLLGICPAVLPGGPPKPYDEWPRAMNCIDYIYRGVHAVKEGGWDENAPVILPGGYFHQNIPIALARPNKMMMIDNIGTFDRVHHGDSNNALMIDGHVVSISFSRYFMRYDWDYLYGFDD